MAFFIGCPLEWCAIIFLVVHCLRRHMAKFHLYNSAQNALNYFEVVGKFVFNFCHYMYETKERSLQRVTTQYCSLPQSKAS